MANYLIGLSQNIVASVVWVTPAFIAHHVLLKRHITRKLDEHHERLKNG